jgi:hypothetical protein
MNTLLIVVWSLLGGAIIQDLIWRYRIAPRRRIDALHEGARVSTEQAVKAALAEDRMARLRKMQDSGRRHAARIDAPTAKIHRIQVGPRPPVNPRNQL